MSKRLSAIIVCLAAMLALPAAASAKDYAPTALNIIPSGQLQPGQPAAPKPNDAQATMYDGLTPLFDNVTRGDLTTYFKSEALNSLGTDGPGTLETIPGHPGIEITRDTYGVPHVDAQTYDDGIFAAGWIAAEDRGLLLSQARYNARVAAIDAPGLSAIGLVTQLKSFVPSQQTEDVVAQQTAALQGAGKEGQKVLDDIDTYIGGINAYFAANSPSTAPFTRNDIYALNALKDQFLGEGGGDEARRTQFLSGLQDRLGNKRGKSVFDDLRQFKNKGVPTTIDGKFRYGSIPKHAAGNVLIDHDSYETTPAVANKALAKQLAPQPVQASNTLMITKQRSKSGNPLMVGGPQIGYFYPGPDLRDRHERAGPEVARRDFGSVPGLPADRPRRGLRDDADLGQRRRHRPIRRAALRRQRHQVQLQGQVPEDGRLQRRHAERRPGLVPDDGAWSGDRLRDGRRLARWRSRRSARATARTSSTCCSTGGSRTAKSMTRSRSSTPRRRRRRRSTRSTSTTSTSPSTRPASCRSVPARSIPAC